MSLFSSRFLHSSRPGTSAAFRGRGISGLSAEGRAAQIAERRQTVSRAAAEHQQWYTARRKLTCSQEPSERHGAPQLLHLPPQTHTLLLPGLQQVLELLQKKTRLWSPALKTAGRRPEENPLNSDQYLWLCRSRPGGLLPPHSLQPLLPLSLLLSQLTLQKPEGTRGNAD